MGSGRSIRGIGFVLDVEDEDDDDDDDDDGVVEEEAFMMARELCLVKQVVVQAVVE
jgi:hypothetical protein